MTHDELISNVLSTRNMVEEFRSQIVNLVMKEKRLLEDYTREHTKYKKGDAVYYTVEKYKTPRKYYVVGAFSYLEYKNGGKYECKTLYEIATANGHKPNSGWSIEEKFLAKAE